MRLLAITLLFPAVVFSQTGQVSVHVTDFNTGVIVTNAEVHAGFNTSIKPGWGWGGGKPNREIGFTDTNGECVLTGSGNSASVGVAAFKEGYYGNSGYSVRFTNTTGTVRKKWQPWNPTIDVVMKRIVNPVPLYAKHVREGKVPKEGEDVGFDLFEGEWVAPYGKGKHSDFLFKLDRKPERIVKKIVNNRSYDETLYDITLSVNGANEGDGFHSLPISVREGGSGLRMPRNAPLEGYEPRVSVRDYRDSIDKPSQNTVDENMNYFFRVRTVLDKDGNVESALYGKIHGDFQLDHHGNIGFTYYLNPTPNDRNVEFDPKKNLFKNLSSSEQVLQP